MTAATRELLPVVVSGYARRLHAAIGDTHHIASPLGAWLVLALAGEAARGPEADRLGTVLGMPTADAARFARELLDNPHPAVTAAAAAWATAPSTPTPAVGATAATATAPASPAADWLAGLPAAVARGPVPSQAEADAWAREHTYGLIDRFPIDMGGGWLCVLASALVTRISWSPAFDTTGADVFRSEWRDRVLTVLRTPQRGHECVVARHPDAGDIAVHRAHAEGLTVTSVIAAPKVPAGQVLAAAHDAALGRIDRYSLFDLVLGDGPSWTVTESEGEAGAERVAAVLPAWTATSEHDLRPPSLGFADAAGVLGRLFGGTEWEAVQAATARYHRTGFEAAAVTAVATRLSFRPPQPGLQRDALLRFDRPYAVVATATSRETSPWSGLPVFSAWVTKPDEVADG
jgi:hypothetical protein